MKEEFEKAEVEIIMFDNVDDIITISDRDMGEEEEL